MAAKNMTGYERVMKALNGEKTDVLPAVNFTTVVTAQGIKRIGVSPQKAHLDSYYMSKLAAQSYEVLGFDTIAPYTSVLLEASALGAVVDWNTSYTTPRIKSIPYNKVEDISVTEQFINKKEIQGLLHSIANLKGKYLNKAAIVGKVMGPWSLAYHLYGAERLVLDMIIKPEETKAMLERLSIVPITFAKKQFEAGADVVVWAEHATRDIVSSKIYEEFILPIHQNANKILKQYGPMVLHICGNIEDRMEYIKKSGFDCLHMDSRNNVLNMVQESGNEIIIAGCINNPVTLLRGDKNQVRNAVMDTIIKGVNMIGPECAIPVDVLDENLIMLTKTVHNY